MEPFIEPNDYVYVTTVTVVTAFRCHYHDGRLLARFRQRRQQPPLPRRMAHPQVLPAPVELVKLQLHQTG
jgi:hypothetical protein